MFHNFNIRLIHPILPIWSVGLRTVTSATSVVNPPICPLSARQANYIDVISFNRQQSHQPQGARDRPCLDRCGSASMERAGNVDRELGPASAAEQAGGRVGDLLPGGDG